MKKIFLCLLVLIFTMNANTAFADRKLEQRYDDIADWDHFEQFMVVSEIRDREIGWSYILSGALVTVGGTIGTQVAEDTASKMLYGLSAGLGIGAIGYGVVRLNNGSPYTSFYEALRRTPLTPGQRDKLVKYYFEREKQNEETIRITRMVTYFLIGGMNLYTASQESDKNTKTFFQFLAGVNFAFALAYTF